MARRDRLGLWLRVGIAFVLGFLAGLVVEFVIGVGRQSGFAIGIAGALAIVASCLAAVLPELFARSREHRMFLREHAELLNQQVYVPIQSTDVTIIGQQLSVPGLAADLLQRGVPDWGYRESSSNALVPVSELSNWNLGQAHFQSDPSLSRSFKGTWERRGTRVSRKEALDSLSLGKVAKSIEEVYGPGFPPAWTFTIPEPRRWFNAPVIINWLRSGTLGYDFTEQVAGNQHRILGGGSMIILTSDEPFRAPAAEFSRVILACRDDPELRAAWQTWLLEDAEDRERLANFFRMVKHASERIQATHEILGHCEVCSE